MSVHFSFKVKEGGTCGFCRDALLILQNVNAVRLLRKKSTPCLGLKADFYCAKLASTSTKLNEKLFWKKSECEGVGYLFNTKNEKPWNHIQTEWF